MSRELIGGLILAAHLAARGHVAIILNQEDAFSLSRGSVSGTTVFHAKSLHYAKERIYQHEKLREAGFLITSMDQENAILNPDVPSVLAERFCEENLEIAHRVFTWNQLEAVELSKQFPKFAAKIVAFGSPRLDSWGIRFRELGKLPSNSRRQILITPSVTMNDSLRHWEHWAIGKSVTREGFIRYEEEQIMLHYLRDELSSQIFFCRLALRLADAYQDVDIIIQPKKSEIKESWVRSLYAFDTDGDGSRPNLHIEYSRILEESIHSAEVVVNSTSTAGLTALIGGVPLVTFGPAGSMASQLGAQVETVEEGFSRVRDALADPQEFVEAYEAKNFEMLGNRVSLSKTSSAASLIVADLETFDSGDRSSVTARDLLLFFYPGSLRRMLSALKATISSQRPVRAHREKVTKITQARVNELLGRIVGGIGTEMKFRAVVAGGRNIVMIPEKPNNQ